MVFLINGFLKGSILMLVLISLSGTAFSQKRRMVNLGGWLIVEKYLTPYLFEDDLQTNTDLCSKVPEKVTSHYASFVTEMNFQYLSQHNIDAVRIPVGQGGYLHHRHYLLVWMQPCKLLTMLSAGERNTTFRSLWTSMKLPAPRTTMHTAEAGMEFVDGINLRTSSKLSKSYTFLQASNIYQYSLGFKGSLPVNDRAVLDIHPYNVFKEPNCDSNSSKTNIDCIYGQRKGLVEHLNGELNKAKLLIGEWANVWHAPEPRNKFSEAQQAVYGEASFGWAYWTLKTGDGFHDDPYWSFEKNIEDQLIK